jgi:hypothetical protein
MPDEERERSGIPPFSVLMRLVPIEVDCQGDEHTAITLLLGDESAELEDS